jgi:hypothetical protein
MGKILEDMLKKVKDFPLDDQLKHFCDEIQKEEEEKFKDLKNEKPVGPNIFLSILVPGLTKNEINFLCLERDFPGVYITSLWSKPIDKDEKIKKTIKRIKVWECKENTAQKILEFYAKAHKFIRSEE